ncbi:ornithine carbamoyltransferase [Thioploca ingrica]|uniref:Ornithine carbamoyltransferase n=1 Tax=Thioploca ingrica TaxID=40754 RepID=A0A090AJD5_9GAMM|nr:ornithine carbamoyltransferase [Thioploca ingrica]
MAPRHFLTTLDFSIVELKQLIARAIELKAMHYAGTRYEPFKNKVLAMIFEKSSTRTRVSFETAMYQGGGNAIFLSPRDTQLGRGEPIEDTARVLSSMVDCVMIRTYAHHNIELFAKYSKVPVINALTDLHHPCQLLADIQTYIEHRQDIQGKRVAWIGDGNNMCHSYMLAAYQFEFELVIACPPEYQPHADLIAKTQRYVTITTDPRQAVKGADLVTTDVWSSMGQEEQHNVRAQVFKTYHVDQQLMSLAKPDAVFLHCLPAHRGEEVSAEVIDGPQSVVWEQAENRLHSQKALLEFLLQMGKGDL